MIPRRGSTFFEAAGGSRTTSTRLWGQAAAICGPIVTELRRGLRREHRSSVLRALDGCTLLEQPEDLWALSGDLGAALLPRGLTVRTLDLLIATYAIAHSARLLTADSDFNGIARAKSLSR